MSKMLAAEAVVRILEDEGVEVAFGIPGAGINPVYRELSKSEKIRHYISHHEEGACHAADGYARASGKVGFCICTSGPAATNFVTGLYTAQVDSVPIVAMTGQNVRAQLGKQAFQSVEIAEIVKPVTKKSYCVMEPDRVPGVMREAFRIAREGRPGPVLIDLPLDVQKEEIEYDAESDSPLEVCNPRPGLRKITKAADMLLAAKVPLMLLGGGVIVSSATDEFAALAEYLSIPVIATYMGKGGIPDDHPLFAGHIGTMINNPLGLKTFLGSDLVLAVGCRFVDRHTGALDVYTKGRTFIHIDIEPTQIGKIIPTALGIVSDARPALQALLEAVKERTPPRDPSERVKDIPKLREQMARDLDFDAVPIKPQRIYKEINEFFDRNTIFTTGCGLNQIWSGQFQKIYKPRKYLVSGCAGTLGFDIPAAIGARLAQPDSRVVAVIGDGGFFFMIEELATACRYDVPIIVLVVNNGLLSLIRQNQKYALDFRYAVDLWYDGHNPDVVTISKGFGCYSERVQEPDEIRPAFQRAVDSGKPSVIDIIVDQETDAAMGPALDAIKEFD
jgi:tartronate-semialdehyde synthase